jgi:hypothetical protein
MRLRLICVFLGLFQGAGCGTQVSHVPADRATPASADEPEMRSPHTRKQDPQAVEQLRAIASRLRPGMVVLGDRPVTDSGPFQFGGSGFVVSAKRRLIATAAHAADHFSAEAQMVAVVDGTVATHRVRRVWYHPGLLRTLDLGLVARSDDRLDGETAYGGPDVAVIQLGDEGPELSAQLELVGDREFETLQGRTVGFLGYPVGTGDRLPGPSRPASATFATSVIGLMPDVRRLGDKADAPETRQYLWYDSSLGPGSSGSPMSPV